MGRQMSSGFLALTILLGLPFSCYAQTPPEGNSSSSPASDLDLPSYEQELTRIEQVSTDPAVIEAVRRSLPGSWTVKTGDRIYTVSTQEISDALREIERDPKKAATVQLKARLEAMRQQADELSNSSPGVNATEAEGKLKKILGRGEFQEATGPSAWEQMRARMNRWIFLHIIKLLMLLHISQKTGNAIAWGVLFLAVILLFYTVYRWLTKSANAVNFRAEAEPIASDARHWMQEALAAADRRDFREAMHCAYWAAVAHLEDVRLLPRDRARTPRESLRLLEQHPREQSLLQSVTRNFELIWYGYRPVSATEWAGTKEQLEKMGCLSASTAPTVPS